MKKIFSLNLICYLKTQGHKVTGIGFDDDSQKVYYTFDETAAVKDSIGEYRKSETHVNLHDFVAEFKDVKVSMHQFQKERGTRG